MHCNCSIKCIRCNDPIQQVHKVEKENRDYVIKDIWANTEYHCEIYAVSQTGKKRHCEKTHKTIPIPPKIPEMPKIHLESDVIDENFNHVRVTVAIPSIMDCNWSEAHSLMLVKESEHSAIILKQDLPIPRTRLQYDFDMILDHPECTFYEFKVRFRNQAGWSQFSTEGKLDVCKLGVGAPQAVTYTIDSRELFVQWNEPKKNPEGVTHYTAQIDGKGKNDSTPIAVEKRQRIVKFTGLLPSTEYKVTLTAITND